MPLFKSCCFIPLAEARVDVRGIPPRHSRAPSSGGERSGGFSSVRAEGVRSKRIRDRHTFAAADKNINPRYSR